MFRKEGNNVDLSRNICLNVLPKVAKTKKRKCGSSNTCLWVYVVFDTKLEGRIRNKAFFSKWRYEKEV